ncbi:NAD-dependent epimerase/dehydratase family protein [Desertibacillus haloalkaliphilus]|uniref:NAD-dependent epimerase/dehydratase family protein n=1 Tax=Desertibacillus haloalkaliphilus TaxID=1328930 RepID=UPI001C263B50|nr:NAD(P)-dependent oxidoreductase [Desertibacillus haloalkaliphilus]MBU8908312.1 NAD(P)-dependent oxidoreductase [Desertibacillus haloalkaliphilus]
MKRVVVTGALGFIGFHLCSRLLEKGIEVYAIDSMIDKKTKHLQEEKWLRIGRNANFHFFDKQIGELNLRRLLKKADVIFHLAAATNQDLGWGDLRSVIKQNVKTTQQLIEGCPKGIHVVYASTIEVYGERTGIITEKTPTNPSTPYGLTKLVSESLLYKESQKHGFSATILRLPTIYGPWQREDMTYHKLIVSKEHNKEMTTVEGDRSTIDVMYIDDVIEGFLLSAAKKQATIYNFSSSKTGEWYRGCQMITGKPEEIEKNRRLQVKVSGEKAKRELGFTPKISLEEGINKQRQHIQQSLNMYKC